MNSGGSSSRLPSSPSEEFPPKGERKEVRLLKQRKKRDDALCLLILGGLSLILSAIFFALSFRYNFLREKLFIPASLEFVVCIICLTLFSALFLWGLIKLIVALIKIERLRKD